MVRARTLTQTLHSRWGNSGSASTDAGTTSLPHCRRQASENLQVRQFVAMPVMNCELLAAIRGYTE